MNLKLVSDDFFGRLNANHILLYVGQNCSSEELKEIAKCPWSAVITSNCEPEFAELFTGDGRSPLQFSSRDEIPAKPLHRKKLPILRLFGISGDTSDEDLSWLYADEDSSYDMHSALQMNRDCKCRSVSRSRLTSPLRWMSSTFSVKHRRRN